MSRVSRECYSTTPSVSLQDNLTLSVTQKNATKNSILTRQDNINANFKFSYLFKFYNFSLQRGGNVHLIKKKRGYEPGQGVACTFEILDTFLSRMVSRQGERVLCAGFADDLPLLIS